jgi:hypothetical protein
MPHPRASVSLLIGVVVLGVVLSGMVWLARHHARPAKILILALQPQSRKISGSTSSSALQRFPITCTIHLSENRYKRALDRSYINGMLISPVWDGHARGAIPPSVLIIYC